MSSTPEEITNWSTWDEEMQKNWPLSGILKRHWTDWDYLYEGVPVYELKEGEEIQPMSSNLETTNEISTEEPELPYGLTEIRIPKAIIRMYQSSPYAGNLPTMTVLYTAGDEEDK